MTVRVFDRDKDYPLVCSWWKQRALPNVPLCILPDAGVIVESPTEPTAVGWMYYEESGRLAVIDWITTNPDSYQETAKGAVWLILDFFSRAAKERGCLNLLSFVASNTGLHRLMVKSGWTDQQSEPHVMLFKALA